MPQYYGSTSPQSAAVVPAQTYSNFNGINTPVLRSTGSFDLTGTIDFNSSGEIEITGEFKHIESTTGQTVVGTCAMPAAYNVGNTGFSILSSSSGDINRFLLQSPVIGCHKKIMFNAGASTANMIYLWCCASSAPTNCVIGTATCGQACIASCGVNPVIELLGVSTGRWMIINKCTASENGGTLSLVSSCYS